MRVVIGEDQALLREGLAILLTNIVSAMLTRHNHGQSGNLTHRQQEVLALMAQGRSNAAIARRLSLTEKAVVGHISHIYDQLGLPPSPEDHRRVLAVVHELTGT